GRRRIRAGVGGDGARGERAWVQTEGDRRRHGRVAVYGDQGPAWTVAQRFHQLRVLAAGGEDAIPRSGRSHFALSGQGEIRRGRSVGILHAALGLRSAPGPATGSGGDEVAR